MYPSFKRITILNACLSNGIYDQNREKNKDLVLNPPFLGSIIFFKSRNIIKQTRYLSDFFSSFFFAGVFVPRVEGSWGKVRRFISCLRFSFFFLKWRSARAQIHSGSTSRDDCGRVFPDELRVGSFPDRFPYYA